MDALVTTEQAAALLGLSVARVRQLRYAGRLQAVKNPARRDGLRFSREQVLALKRERETWQPEVVPA